MSAQNLVVYLILFLEKLLSGVTEEKLRKKMKILEVTTCTLFREILSNNNNNYQKLMREITGPTPIINTFNSVIDIWFAYI